MKVEYDHSSDSAGEFGRELYQTHPFRVQNSPRNKWLRNFIVKYPALAGMPAIHGGVDVVARP
jgi:hypothetical protein